MNIIRTEQLSCRGFLAQFVCRSAPGSPSEATEAATHPFPFTDNAGLQGHTKQRLIDTTRDTRIPPPPQPVISTRTSLPTEYERETVKCGFNIKLTCTLKDEQLSAVRKLLCLWFRNKMRFHVRHFVSQMFH